MSDSDRSSTMDALRMLLPFLEAAEGGPLEERVESAPVEQLRRFYLFGVSGLVLPNDESEIRRFVERRYLNLLSAAHRAGWTVLTAAVGSPSGVRLHFGFMAEDSNSPSDPYVFERILRGVLPGLEIRFEETSRIESFLRGKEFGGLIAGVPMRKIDDERQHFSLPAVLRSLHGESYALLLLSRPVQERELADQLRRVWTVRDECHALARHTRSQSYGESKTTNEGISETQGRSIGGGIGLPLPGTPLIIGTTLSKNRSETHTKGTAEGFQWTDALMQEQQSSLFVDLERLAERQCERLLRGANVGEWETAITFATKTKAGRDILAGSLLGELAKPSTDVFPPRVYYADLVPDRPLLLPGQDGMSAVFPRSLASYLTSEELASIAAPPSEQLPGYELRRTPSLSLTDARSETSQQDCVLGAVCDHGRALDGVDVQLSPSDLAKHLFVCGLTGSGKTTTVKEILAKTSVPFLVLEAAKRDYRQLIGVDALRDRMRVYTVGDASVAPIQMNPFYVLPGVSPVVHIDYLKAIFNASFSLYGPMPYIVEKCLHNLYLKRGWDLTRGCHPRLYDADGHVDEQRYQGEEAAHCFPTLLDLKEEVHEYVRTRLDYRGELSDNIRTAIVTRLESLAVGAKGVLFGSATPLDIAELLKHPTVLELEALSDDDDKAFFLGLILTFISEYRQSSNPALNPYAARGTDLLHLLVIEEAHRLLKNVTQERQSEYLGNPRGKAVEFFANVISEMRSMGQGVIVVEQIPTKLLPDVIKNTNAKIVHRLVARDDQVLLAASLGLHEEESLYLTALQTGHALHLKEGMQRPVEVEIQSTVPSPRIGHERVKRAMLPRSSVHEADAAAAMEVRNILVAEGDALVLRLLCTIACCELSKIGTHVAEVMEAATSLLLQRDRVASANSIRQYLTDRIVALLANGMFRLAGDSIQGTARLAADLLNGKEQAGPALRQRLANGWGADEARNGAVRRIRELVLDRTLRARVGADQGDAVDRIVRTYFLSDIPTVRRDLVAQVTARLGG